MTIAATITQSIPEVNLLLALEPEELGAKLLFIFRSEEQSYNLHLHHLHSGLCGPHHINPRPYPEGLRAQAEQALTEAWAWLEAQGLLIPSDSTNGSSGYKKLSRRALKIENATDFASFQVARMLPKELLNSKIANPVWSSFVRGEYDIAAFQAMKGVEIAVRKAAGYGNDLYGTDLMRKAFHPSDGPLTDLTTEDSERQARSALFAGAIGSFKNPHSHRAVNLDNPYEALEIILLANHLLRIVDSHTIESSH